LLPLPNHGGGIKPAHTPEASSEEQTWDMILSTMTPKLKMSMEGWDLTCCIISGGRYLRVPTVPAPVHHGPVHHGPVHHGPVHPQSTGVSSAERMDAV
jgi:hypothetical protein